ncbi:MAG: DUF4097 family beta strand repeat-containing protein [Bacillota bacterium]|nr:DUF4097 family beta strand repeat-containing protein [Bacillota bacterium]
MNFFNKLNIRKLVIYLLGIMFICYGAGALFIFSNNGREVWKEGSSYNINESNVIEDLNGLKDIEIDVPSTDIDVITEGTNQVKAELNGSLIASGKVERPELQCYKDGNKIYIKVIQKSLMVFNFFYRSNIKLNVYIPDSYKENLSVHSSSGDVNISNHTFNKLKSELTSGNLQVNNINTDTFEQHSSSGDVKAERLTTKNTTIDVTSGTIRLNKFNGDLQTRSSSGDTSIEYDNFNNKVDIQATSGNIKLKLPKSAEFALDASASSGGVNCKFPISFSEKGEHVLKGTVGSGKNNINIVTSSGDINISQ